MSQIALINFLLTLGIILLIVLILVVIFMIIFEYTLFKYDEKDFKQKKDEELSEEFYETLNDVSSQITKEVLESLIEMEKLDKLYNEITQNDQKFMDELSYLKTKQDILNKIISDKVKEIEENRIKKEKYKALLDEIKVCKKRFPQYNDIFVENINIIKSKIEKLK